MNSSLGDQFSGEAGFGEEIRGSINLLPASSAGEVDMGDEEGSPTATKKYPDYCRTLRIKGIGLTCTSVFTYFNLYM